MTCPACGSSHKAGTVLVRYRSGVEIVECPTCQSGITLPPPHGVAYDAYAFARYIDDDPDRWRAYARQFMTFVDHTTQGHTGRLLDVGTGGGLLVEAARARGYDAEGIEPAVPSVVWAWQHGLPVRHGYLAAGSYRPGTFDVVTFNQVIEHLEDATAILQAVAPMLAPGGVVCLGQTNFRGTVPTILGRHWPSWVPDEHFVHFSLAGLRTLLHRSGYTIIRIEYAPAGYYLYGDFRSPRAIATSVINAVAWGMTRMSIGAPFWADQIHVAALRIEDVAGAGRRGEP